MPDDRDFDIVLFGATGFTGALTAEYLARNAPADLRWALAGRSPDKLQDVRAHLAAIDPALADLELLHAEVSDPTSLADVARRARVVITTVGPYLKYGEPLVAACAEAGTDYVDLTGEPEFVDRMYVAHHATAQRTGARIVHACGFDSIPHDLGALFTVQHLPKDEPVTVRGVVRVGAMASGGTFHSAMTALSRRGQMKEASSARRRAEARPEGRSSRAVVGKPHRDPVLGYWLLPLPTIDPVVVARSGAALPAYGPKFRYSHYAGTKTLRYAAGGAAVVAGLGLAAQVKPLRNLLMSRIQPGDGPDERPPREVVVPRRLRRRGGRRHHPHPGLRRRPRLRRDLQDARRVRPVPGPGRQPGDLRPGHHGAGHGRQPDGPPAEGRDQLRGRRLTREC